MQLRTPLEAGATPALAPPRRGVRPGDAIAGGGDAGVRHEDHAMAGEPSTHAEVEPVVDDGQGGIETAERLPHPVPHEHAARSDSHDIAQHVALTLVELVDDDRNRRAVLAQGFAERAHDMRLVPVHLLGPGRGDRRRRLECGDERGEGAGFGCAVLSEKPQQFAVRRGRRAHPHGGRDRCPERHVLTSRHHVGGASRGEQIGGSVGGGAVHCDDHVGCEGLLGEGRECSLKMVAAVAGDDDGGNSRRHRMQP